MFRLPDDDSRVVNFTVLEVVLLIVWHVISKKKLLKYMTCGHIRGPVRAWKNIESAQRFSCQTGRRIILRLKFPDAALPYFGHRNEAVYIDDDYVLDF